MLVLTRKPGQVIRIGNDIFIEILSVTGDNVKVGIKAPNTVTILREEVYQSVSSQNQESVIIPAQGDLANININPMNEAIRAKKTT